LAFSFASAVAGQPQRPEGLRAQDIDKSELGSIRGRVVLPDGETTNFRISLLTFRDTIATVYTDVQGQFEFAQLAPGDYQLEVEPPNRGRWEKRIEEVRVYKTAPSLVTIVLKEHRPANLKPAKSTISVAELARDVPSRAKKEFEKATSATAKGQTKEAIAYLRKAIEIYPDFAAAHNDLGVQLLSLGKIDEAREAFERAVKLQPDAFNPALNLGIVYVHLHRFAEARQMLARAIKADPNSAAARLYSGLASEGLNDLETAQREFMTAYERGGTAYAMALFHLGQLHLSQGNRSLARQYFERYLADRPAAANADQVRQLIAVLR
jgi:tetratricopeptide (TPR) repeat protein